MTIAVANLAIAAAAPMAASMPAGGEQPAGDSITTGDFASLLLGQLVAGQLPVEANGLAEQAAATDLALTGEDTDATAVTADPALLFAALGLPVPATPAGPESQGKTGQDDVMLSGNAGRKGLPLTAADIAEMRRQPGQGDPLAGELAAGKTLSADAAAEDMKNMQQPTFELPNDLKPAKVAGATVAAADIPRVAGSNTLPQGSELNVAAAQRTAPGNVPPATEMSLPTPVRDAAWPAEFSQKVVWMARQDLGSAQITLNPPQLGPIEITLDVRNDQASATFVSGNAEVREAIESALPRLREMFAGVGVELGQTNVSQESFRQMAEQNGNRQENGRTAAGGLDAARQAASGTESARPVRSGNGLVDTFA